ncbi:PEP-CTERM sorting domain-containing protein [Akkermansiaceae bacterium]|nr:PEP-CTERM sorting domain-containing protein [Akkermansiaceae bacterium]
MKTIFIGSLALFWLSAHATAAVLQVNETRTVLADGTVVANDGSGNLVPSVAPAGIVGPTSASTFQYAIRERAAAQQAQVDRAGYSFFKFDLSSLSPAPTDPGFSAIFSIDYVGHLNNLNAWNVDLGQVNGAWDISGDNDPTRALSQGSTCLGTLVAGVEGEPSAINGIEIDITTLVQGWADGSIANNGLTFTGSLVSQSAYFNNATITTSVVPEPSSASLAVLAIAGMVIRRKRR